MSQPPKPTDEWADFLNFVSEKTARKPRTPKGAKPVTANQLTAQIVTFFRERGYFASRLSSTGVYRDDLKKYVPSTQVSGMPDLFGLVLGHFIGVEVKIGTDRLSETQKATHLAMMSSGAFIFTARDFDSFKDWFDQSVVPAIILP